MSGESIDLPLYAIVLSIMAIASAMLVVRLKDLVYASITLAILGSFTAALLAVAGFGLVSAYLVLVYVGAAVMFIVISISMIGPQGQESFDSFRGLTVAAALATFIITVVVISELYRLFTVPPSLSASAAAAGALREYLPVLALIFIGQAATVVEAISIAKRGGRK
ncbi:NADH-quinone oxidoreductase subunit J [Acidilobus saccharovorans 345-15]|uniref:NADH-quinone oxidoreductase subunit J n=1 Tax=Acidilobus saccharovorans (strain DSM 16705 / JCM 18335 / VKM B-2471 / 345-15) TaxID=666510 RepID=D9Q0E6_ACIS3|nr:NADH-quinone oxidoreductase subunit J [Acidilobus saccharovorans]ADL18784.1 NADH-quinone oxidoreductase subunit J [Acidilobus saccharovorans 345-15]